MNNGRDQGIWQMISRDFFEVVWPRSLTTDSDLQRRKKTTVRAGQLSMTIMILVGLVGTLVVDRQRMSGARMIALALISVVYIVWSLAGIQSAVRFLLLGPGVAKPSLWTPGRRLTAVSYFGVQLGLAGLLYGIAARGHGSMLLWLALLPPVAHSVILLPHLGIAIVAALTMAIFVAVMVWVAGVEQLGIVVLEFSFAVLFTVIFTWLAVGSERARVEVQRLAAELSEANAKLREYAMQAEELAVVRERNRLAREIHDTLGHYLTVVNVQIEAARAVQDQDPTRARDALDKAQALTREGLQEIRRSVTALRASPLDHQPLADALNQIVKESCADGLKTEMQVFGEPRVLSPQTALTLYRAGQEGLTNVRKHARAATTHLELDFRAAGSVCLRVRDDGAGATPENSGGFGLLGLRERAQFLGGELRVQTAPGAGFTLEVEVPG